MLTNAPLAARRYAARRAVLARGLVDRVWRRVAAFRADRSGNVTLIFALALIPVFGAVGAAVDYSRGNSARTAMQAALDATALMVSREALDLKRSEVQQKAKTYFKAQFSRTDVKNLNLSFKMIRNGPGDFTVVADATAKMDTAIARVIGVNQMDLGATTQVRWGFKALELALALDNTGSMASKNKMVELKTAVKLLFATLKKHSKVPDDTKIAIIPFSTVVNLGTEFADAPWIAYDSKITRTHGAAASPTATNRTT